MLDAKSRSHGSADEETCGSSSLLRDGDEELRTCPESSSVQLIKVDFIMLQGSCKRVKPCSYRVLPGFFGSGCVSRTVLGCIRLWGHFCFAFIATSS